MLEISHQTEKRTLGDAPPHDHIGSERGFTLIEVMVTIGILMFGLLTVLQLVDVSNRSTVSTAARVTVSNVARRVAEVAKSLPYSDLTQANGPAAIQAAAPDLADSNTSDTKWTVVRESKTIEITTTFCAVDDPRDGLGTHDASFCSGQPSTSTPSDATPTDLIRLVTLVQVDGGRFKIASVIPANTAIDLPWVKSVALNGKTSPITSPDSSATFDVTTVNLPDRMSWLLDGTVKESCTTATGTPTCSGNGDIWSFTAPLGTPVTQGRPSPNAGLCLPNPDPNYVNDGFPKMGARVFDEMGRSGTESSTTVTMNRCAPYPVTNFVATSGSGIPPAVDVEWSASPEGDVLGYRVYKSTQPPVNDNPSLPGGTQICPPAGDTVPLIGTSCTDFDPAAGAPASPTDHYYYAIRAVDYAPDGSLREGALTWVDIRQTPLNNPPNVPTSFSGSRSGPDNVLSWTVPTDPDNPVNGDSVGAFRIYRNMSGVGPFPNTDRIAYLDVQDLAVCAGSAPGSSCKFTDPNVSANYSYWVTAVDSHLRESDYSTAVSVP